MGPSPNARELRKRKQGDRTAVPATMAVISSLLVSMAPATASTISPRIGISIAVPTAQWKMAGPRPSAKAGRCSWTSCRFMKARPKDLIESTSLGVSTAKKIPWTSETKRKVSPVDDKLDALGPLLNEIGLELVDLVGGDRNGVFLYVEIGDGWVSSSVFKDEGDVVRYYNPRDTQLSDMLFDAWYLEPEGPNMRWSVLEYSINGGKFDVSMTYPEEVNVDVPDVDRREAALRARFGDKPVVYPPMPKTAFELRP